jgi:hypothetical protein
MPSIATIKKCLGSKNGIYSLYIMKFGDFILGKVFEMEDIITQDRYLQVCNKYPDTIQYSKVDHFYEPSVWRGKYYNISIAHRPVLVSSHGDRPVNKSIIEQLRSPVIKKWFTTNADCYDDLVEGIPHGLTNDCDDTPIHHILGNQDILREVLLKEKQYKNTAYMNFSFYTNYHIRSSVWNTFINKDFIKAKYCLPENMNLIDRKAYLEDVADSKFIICPEGSGIDTVRVWESLYCRSIPIVKRHKAMRYFEGRLPILWIDDWSDVESRFYLEKHFEQIMDSHWDLDILKMGYWEKRFSSISESED